MLYLSNLLCFQIIFLAVITLITRQCRPAAGQLPDRCRTCLNICSQNFMKASRQCRDFTRVERLRKKLEKCKEKCLKQFRRTRVVNE